ncbi:hypothetical protein [Fodinibius sp.]|nr:hypothetical protein [Fodinibius sp.]
MAYSVTDTQWGLIGSATSNGWDSDASTNDIRSRTHTRGYGRLST